MNGYDKVCSALVNLGADPNVMNKISKTPLIYAAAEGHVKVLEVLVKCPNIDLESKGKIDDGKLVLGPDHVQVNCS